MAGWIVILVTTIVEMFLAHVLKVELWRAVLFSSIGGLSFCAYLSVDKTKHGGA